MKFDKLVFSRNLKELMDTNQVSNYALAKAIGCAQSSVSNWLEGKTKPGAGYVNAMVAFFGVNLWELIGVPEDNSSQKKQNISKGEKLADSDFMLRYKRLPLNERFQIDNLVDLSAQHPDRAPTILGDAVLAFGDTNWTPKNEKSPGLSTEAAQLATDYDDMDKWGRKAVRDLASNELSRVQDHTEDDENMQRTGRITRLQPAVKDIPLLGTSFAAGTGEIETGNTWSLFTVPDSSPADFAIRIAGDSMEPYLEDGSIALCTRDNPRDGDVAAFLIDGDFICKQVCQDITGALHLFSLNRDRKDADRHIPRDGIERQIICFGTVLMDKTPPLPLD